MLVYHGSIYVVEQPEIKSVNRPMDFGVGFYTTSIEEQAKQWALRKSKRNHSKAVINMYKFDKDEAKKHLRLKEFRTASREWIELILLHRKMKCYNKTGLGIEGVHHSYDIVIGEVADDDIYDSIELYESGIISKEELTERVKHKSKNDQITFSTSSGLKYLSYLRSYML